MWTISPHPSRTAAGRIRRLRSGALQSRKNQSPTQLCWRERLKAPCALEAEDRFLLAAYYLDERTLLQIAQVLHVHEATVSRRLKRVCQDMRKQVLKNLQRLGLSRRAADEALGTDPRDLDMNLKKLLQNSQSEAFQEQAAR